MTIAAGFTHSQGILLAADTAVSTSEWKGQRAKLGHFEYSRGRFAYVLAGNSVYAMSFIEKVQERLESSSVLDVKATVEEILELEYRRLVYADPSYPHDPYLHFWCLFAFRPHGGKYNLFGTNCNAINRVPNYQCIGIGEALARAVIEPLSHLSQEASVVHVALYALAWAKRHVESCGGATMLLNLRHDGRVAAIWDKNTQDIGRLERFFEGFNLRSWELLSLMINPNVPQHAFGNELSRFRDQLLEERRKMMEPMEIEMRKLKENNPSRAIEEVEDYFRFPVRDP